jgi:hypothetical protein
MTPSVAISIALNKAEIDYLYGLVDEQFSSLDQETCDQETLQMMTTLRRKLHHFHQIQHTF